MTNRIDTDIRGRYPYPLSATFHRAYYETRDPAMIHDYMLDLFEVTVKYLASIVIAQYVKDGSADAALNNSLLNLQRPSLGHWQGWLRDIIRLYGRQKQSLALPEIGAFYEQRHTTDVFQAYNGLRQMMTEHMDYKGDGKNSPAITTQQFFDLLGTYRNKIAHGARLNVFDRERVCKMLIPAMRELFKNLAFLAEYQLVYVTEVKLTAGPTRRVTRYGHYFTDLTGYLPSVSLEPVLLDQAAAHPNELYILAKGETFTPLLSLHPFLIYRHCERCSDERVFVLNTSRENTLSYLSYACSHQFSLTEYLDDIRAVLGGVDIAVPISTPMETSAPPAPVETPEEPITVAPFVDQGTRVLDPVAPTPTTIQCPNPVCRATNVAGRNFCTRCGMPLAQAPPPPVPPRPAPPTVAAPPVTAPTPTVTCPRCSRANQVGRKFCTACGTSLAGLAPVGGPGGGVGPGPGPGNVPPPPWVATSPPPPPAPFDPANTRLLGPLPISLPSPPAEPAASVPCATCGQVNPAGRRFCQNCGVTLTAAPPSAPPPAPPAAQAEEPRPAEPDAPDGATAPPAPDAAPTPPPGDHPAPPPAWSKKGK